MVGARVIDADARVVRPGRAPAGRLRLPRQRGDELILGLEPFLLVDDGVAVEDGAARVAGQAHGAPLGHAGADQGAGGWPAGTGCRPRRSRRSGARTRFGPSSVAPAKGWEKGSVEGGVKYVRNLVFRPRLAVESWAALNALLITELRGMTGRPQGLYPVHVAGIRANVDGD